MKIKFIEKHNVKQFSLTDVDMYIDVCDRHAHSWMYIPIYVINSYVSYVSHFLRHFLKIFRAAAWRTNKFRCSRMDQVKFAEDNL